MIDIWLLFGLVLPFFAFTLSILEELVVQRDEEEDEKLSQVGTEAEVYFRGRQAAPASALPPILGKRSPMKGQATIHLLGRRILPIVTVAFIAFYCIVANFLYFFPSLQYGL